MVLIGHGRVDERDRERQAEGAKNHSFRLSNFGCTFKNKLAPKITKADYLENLINRSQIMSLKQ